MTKTVLESNTASSVSPNTFRFGGLDEVFTEIGDVGNQQIIFRGGNAIASIQIGSTVYGGSGGGELGRATLPPDGRFYLTQLQASVQDSKNQSMAINYFEAEIGGVIIKCGKQNLISVIGMIPELYDTTLLTNVYVKFSGIGTGKKYVNSVQFEIVS